MARRIRDPAMDAIVVILFYPFGVQSHCQCRHLGAGHLAAGSTEQTFDLPLGLGVMERGIIHSPVDPRTDATKLTTSKLAAAVAHALPRDPIREDGRFEDFNP